MMVESLIGVKVWVTKRLANAWSGPRRAKVATSRASTDGLRSLSLFTWVSIKINQTHFFITDLTRTVSI